MFDLKDAAGVMREVDACRRTFPNHYVKVNAFDATRGVESLRLSFIVNRPQEEPGFSLCAKKARAATCATRLRAYATSGRKAAY